MWYNVCMVNRDSDEWKNRIGRITSVEDLPDVETFRPPTPMSWQRKLFLQGIALWLVAFSVGYVVMLTNSLALEAWPNLTQLSPGIGFWDSVVLVIPFLLFRAILGA